MLFNIWNTVKKFYIVSCWVIFKTSVIWMHVCSCVPLMLLSMSDTMFGRERNTLNSCTSHYRPKVQQRAEYDSFVYSVSGDANVRTESTNCLVQYVTSCCTKWTEVRYLIWLSESRSALPTVLNMTRERCAMQYKAGKRTFFVFMKKGKTNSPLPKSFLVVCSIHHNHIVHLTIGERAWIVREGFFAIMLKNSFL